MSIRLCAFVLLSDDINTWLASQFAAHSEKKLAKRVPRAKETLSDR
jgi:hypothetical protein